jgi:hypothetical protein
MKFCAISVTKIYTCPAPLSLLKLPYLFENSAIRKRRKFGIKLEKRKA